MDASDITPLASFCDLLEAFFYKVRPTLRGPSARRPLGKKVHGQAGRALGKRGHGQIVLALHKGDLNTATDLLRSHLSYYVRSSLTVD